MAHFPSSCGRQSGAQFWHVLYIDDVDEKNSERILESAVSDFPIPVVFTVVANCFSALERVEMTEFDLIMIKSDLEHFNAEEFVRVVRNIDIFTRIILMVPEQKKTPKSLRHSNLISAILRSPFSFQTLRVALLDSLSHFQKLHFSLDGNGTSMSTTSCTPSIYRGGMTPTDTTQSPNEFRHREVKPSSISIPSPPKRLIDAARLQQQVSIEVDTSSVMSHNNHYHHPVSGYNDEAERKLLASTTDFIWYEAANYSSVIVSASDTDSVSPRASVSSHDSDEVNSLHKAISFPPPYPTTASTMLHNKDLSHSGSSHMSEDISSQSTKQDILGFAEAMDEEDVAFMAGIPWENIFSEEYVH